MITVQAVKSMPTWGVYKDIEVSKAIADEMVYCKEPSYGVAVEPIDLGRVHQTLF